MKFQDYYETLGVARNASQDEIQRAFRKLARELHPDLNKSAGAEDKFKQLNEAYEVLSDPEKRRRYDALGSNWQNGQDFQPPPGYDRVRHSFSQQDMGGFSDFFEALFGGGAEGLFGQMRGQPGARGARFTGQPGPVEAEITLELEEIARGGKKALRIQSDDGRARNLEITIPPGTTDGSVIRLSGQGGGGRDLLLKVAVRPHPIFQVSGFDLVMRLPVAPWEAALGAELPVHLLDSQVKLKVPAGVQSGQRLRIGGKGLRSSGSHRGDLYVEIQIVVPRALSEGERELFSKLSAVSRFNPRQAA